MTCHSKTSNWCVLLTATFVARHRVDADEQLQRTGRTGRKRDGQVHVLMSEGREDTNWDTAQQTHRDIQEEILHSRNLDLFDDVERLLPPGQFPECVEQLMEVDPWEGDDNGKPKKGSKADVESGTGTKKRSTTAKEPKEKKEKKQRGHEIPEDGHVGFKSVADLLRDSGKMEGSKSRGKRPAHVSSEEEASDEEEEELEDIIEILGNSGKSDEAKGKDVGEASNKPKKTTKSATEKAKAKAPPAKKRKTPKQIREEEAEEERRRKEEEEEEKALREQAEQERQEQARRDREALDFFAAVGTAPRRRGMTPDLAPSSASSSSASSPARSVRSPSIHPSPVLVSSSPPPEPLQELQPERTPQYVDQTRAQPSPPINALDVQHQGQATGVAKTTLTPRTAALAGFSQIADADLNWESDLMSSPPPAPPSSRPKAALQYPAIPVSSSPAQAISPLGKPSAPTFGPRRRLGLSRPRTQQSTPALSTPVPLKAHTSRELMPPPPLPQTMSSPLAREGDDSTVSTAATQFPVRKAGRRRIALPSSDDQGAPAEVEEGNSIHIVDSSPAMPTRLKRRLGSSPVLQDSPVAARAPKGRPSKKLQRGNANAFVSRHINGVHELTTARRRRRGIWTRLVRRRGRGGELVG